MKLGILAPTFFAPTLTDLSPIAERGFQAVQVMVGGLPKDGKKPEDPDAEALVAELKRTEIDLAAIACHVPLFGETEAVTAGLARMMELIDYAATLAEAPSLRPRPTLNWHAGGYLELLDTGVDNLLDQLGESMRSVCTHAANQGVDISIEMTRMGLPDNVDKFLRLREHAEADNLLACLDAANFTPDRDLLEVAVRRLAHCIAYAHAKDVIFKTDGSVETYPCAGKGVVDYDLFIAALKEHTDCPYMMTEYMRTDEDVTSVVEFLKAKL